MTNKPRNIAAKRPLPRDLSSLRLLLPALLLMAGCGDSTPSSAPTPAPSSSQTYFAPSMTGAQLGRATFAIDHTADTFVQYLYQATAGNEKYVYNSGNFTALSNGILDIGITYGNGSIAQGTIYNPPQSGNWAVDIPGEAAYVGLLNQPFVPIAPNQACPSYATAGQFQFVTLPNAGDSTGTAYGDFTIATSGTSVTFGSIAQYTISGAAPSNPSTASVAGVCSPTFFGQTVSVPSTDTVTNPGSGGTTTPSATIGVGPTGFLVEDNGYIASSPPTYVNVLGAGSGAIGLPVPATAISTSDLLAAQYTGFIFSTGSTDPVHPTHVAVPSTTLVSSFGYTGALPSSCAAPAGAGTGTLLYGGEFSGNDPSSNGYGNCDVAVDLGAEDAQKNGRYPNATVYLSAAFPRTPSNQGYPNQTSAAYSFPAVAIVNVLQGRFIIALIGYDATGLQSVVSGATQDWGLYLIQAK